MKSWFKLRSVEYSTDFNFFLKEQIMICKSHLRHEFNSRLESFCFDLHFLKHPVIPLTFYEDKMPEKQIYDICKKIHQKLLSGKYGQGEFVN